MELEFLLQATLFFAAGFQFAFYLLCFIYISTYPTIATLWLSGWVAQFLLLLLRNASYRVRFFLLIFWLSSGIMLLIKNIKFKQEENVTCLALLCSVLTANSLHPMFAVWQLPPVKNSLHTSVCHTSHPYVCYVALVFHK